MCNPGSLPHHEYFPHILEGSCSQPRKPLRNAGFRRTCRLLRGQVDNILARHLVHTDCVRTAEDRRMPTFSPCSTHRPTERLLDVYGDPSPALKLALQYARLLTARVYGGCHQGGLPMPYAAAALTAPVPPLRLAYTLILNFRGSGYAHFVTAATGECHTLAMPSILQVVFLNGIRREMIRMIVIKEWERECGLQSPILELAN